MMKHNFQVTDALLEVFVDLFEQVGATILCLCFDQKKQPNRAFQWIGLRENPQEIMDFPWFSKLNMAFSCNFFLKLIH